ncbi:TetR/AcrR family transcriptional regulator [Caenimonas soli]|uniref:TetR/AcrR family transcriptional regulator n=1 Tax=Caenimonas soli TaxID=2735555 RepID=UPI001552E6C4|nr:TetR/AcrR family transcriptional regulator [Caenimonas soli]NPC54953.1 TetR/AcrR family transcriptional regulator [Caenimonas soli]
MHSSPRRPALSHKQRLIKQGMKQFYAHGFHGTSVDTVLEAAAAPKGSFYHHFGSKDAFAMAVVREYHEAHVARLGRWAQEGRLDASERLCGYLKELTSAFEHLGCKHGCLIGKFSLELAPASEGFGALLSSMLVGWKASIEQIIADGQTNRLFRDDLPSSNLADLVLSGIQGSVLLGLAHRDSAALRNLEVTIPALLARPVAR